MKTQLSITRNLEAIFHQTCKELNLTAYCIQEDMDSNRYEVHYDFPHDLFYLGITVGMKATHEIFTK